MSLQLVRSHGIEIKTYPSGWVAPNVALRIARDDQEDLYFSLSRAVDEAEYTLHELQMDRWQDIAAIDGFRRYIASMRPTPVDYLDNRDFLRAGESFHEYEVPGLKDSSPIDWCGVLINPTDFLHAMHYVLTNTAVEQNDPRVAFTANII